MKETKQCYTCYEKHSDDYCPKCFSSLHWDLTKSTGRNDTGIYLTDSAPKVSK